MTNPSIQPSVDSLGNIGRPGSLFQQILDEIHGRDTATALCNRSTPQATPKLPPTPHAIGRRTSSVWIGGTSIAQEAREKLRAVDQARYKTAIHGTDGTPSDYSLSLRSLSLPICSTSSSSEKIVEGPGHSESEDLDSSETTLSRPCIRRVVSSGLEPPSLRATVGGLRLPSSNFVTQRLCSSDHAEVPKSPLMFCDIDSDVSSSPSPTEAPTSAVTVGSTEATTVSDGHSSSRNNSRPNSPRKRVRSRHASPDMMSKKIRTMPFHEARGSTTMRSKRSTFSTLGAVGGGDRSLVRSSTFIERTPTPPETISPIEEHALPNLASFRPKVASPRYSTQPSTPVRVPARRATMPEQDGSPPTAETPSFARALHLIDSDISIYKNDHGEEWRENSLCRHCFRQHGSFNRILTHGYEVCGREEMLNSHYWEPAHNP
ncbi:uncharacterized protein K460DRAFT_411881 [Cucurbitaria berberidis CBS 394.84]|uniref:Uncharacterized protein n=1 Tax=Cucurbitaria berberidis CBS 394.84 TaxID=1168544 RepID=A0A9P4LD83_9PLEO|nr:uncharacterized protein K460DRAFT_411881 [Cucurbitaria berberidis CBS 394.84]KAF1850117.1 hypothetical protein K460DRAFT_411881 [Cucurbitaria berberidis CBS 394.84]